MEQHYLTPLFAPASIAVFAGRADQPDGQTDYGRALVAQLRDAGFPGPLNFVEAGMSGTLADLLQARADLALIALPHAELALALELAGRMRCRAALIVSSGVAPALAAELHAVARRHDMVLLGPNCLGYQRPRLQLNASAAGALARPGGIALVSQSGALTSAILDWAATNAVGFSTIVSLGPNPGVDLAQTLDFLATDPATESIVICMEGVTDARRFLSALRGVASTRPVVVLKSGHGAGVSQAAATHSGSLTASDQVFDAALRRTGAVRVRSFVQLFSAAKCLASRYRPVGARLAVVSNGAGPALLAADWIAEQGLEPGRLGPEAAAALAPLLAPGSTLTELTDLSAAATPQHYDLAIRACAADPGIDGILALYSPRFGVGSDPDAVAQALAALAAEGSLAKPLLTCWMGDEQVAGARRLLNQAGLATFRTPEAAVDGFGSIAAFYRNQQLLRQTPAPLSQLAKPDLDGARRLIESVLAERRSVLTEMESKALLAAFQIPITHTLLARSAGEAMLIASQLGYPVALKIDSPDIVHKTDVQGVALNVLNAAGVADIFDAMQATVRRLQPQARINGVTVQKMAGKRDGRELYIGVADDPLFGPAISFGAGGTMIELLNDRAIELPPLNGFLAQKLIGRARADATLGPWRGAPAVDRTSIEQVLLRVSEMVCELPQLLELDINPLIVDQHGALAVDARVVVGPAPGAASAAGAMGGTAYGHAVHAAPGARGASALRHARLAILPYPSHYARDWPLRGGGQYTLRPVQPGDAAMLQALVRGLSEQSRYYRFASSLRELSLPMLARYTLIDYDRDMALVAVQTQRTTAADGAIEEHDAIIGVSRYIANPDRSSAEFSLLVDDRYSGQGLGTRLMQEIMAVARDKGLSEIDGLVLAKNRSMLKLMASLGFRIERYVDDPDFQLCSKAL